MSGENIKIKEIHTGQEILSESTEEQKILVEGILDDIEDQCKLL